MNAPPGPPPAEAGPPPTEAGIGAEALFDQEAPGPAWDRLSWDEPPVGEHIDEHIDEHIGRQADGQAGSPPVEQPSVEQPPVEQPLVEHGPADPNPDDPNPDGLAQDEPDQAEDEPSWPDLGTPYSHPYGPVTQPVAAGWAALGPAERSGGAFTMPAQEVPRDQWLDPSLHGGRRAWAGPVPARPIRKTRTPRSLAVALPLMVLLSLTAAFFSWVSAEPLWLAVGHGQAGTVTVTSCGSGLSARCLGEFTARTGGFTAARVTLLGTAELPPGQSFAARMVSTNSHRAYLISRTAAINGTAGLNLRWLTGLVLVLLCGLGTVFASGALRLPDRRERLAALGTSFAAPLLIAIGFLAATF